MIYCRELNHTFSTQKDLYRALIANKERIIKAKKTAVKSSDPVSFLTMGTKEVANKEEGEAVILQHGDTIDCVMNSTGIIDTHRDLHVKGIWDNAPKQSGEIYHAVQHKVEFGSIVAFPKDVNIKVIPMLWRDLGEPYEGYTEALIFESKVTDITNDDVFKTYSNNMPVKHSISMIYKNILLAVNDSSEDFKEYYANYIKYKSSVVNPEALDSADYFWAVLETEIYQEGSTVLFPSNKATPYLGVSNTRKEDYNIADAIKSIKIF